MSSAQLASYTRYDSSVVPPEERWDYWRTWYGEAVASHMRLERLEATPTNWDAGVEVLELGDVTLTHVKMGAAQAHWDMQGTEESGVFRICLFYDAPRLRMHWQGRDVAVANGTALMHGRSGGSWHAPGGFRSIQLNIPRALLPLSADDLDKVAAGQNHGQDTVFQSIVRPMLLGAVGRLRALSVLPNNVVDEISRTWVPAVSTMVMGLSGRASDDTVSRLSRATQARRYIRHHLSDGALDPESVAQALHISRRTLYASFAGEQGVAAVIRQERLQAAAAYLRNPDFAHRGIAQIGAMVGLGDVAYFSRAFKSEFGVSPRVWRADEENRDGTPAAEAEQA